MTTFLVLALLGQCSGGYCPAPGYTVPIVQPAQVVVQPTPIVLPAPSIVYGPYNWYDINYEGRPRTVWGRWRRVGTEPYTIEWIPDQQPAPPRPKPAPAPPKSELPAKPVEQPKPPAPPKPEPLNMGVDMSDMHRQVGIVTNDPDLGRTLGLDTVEAKPKASGPINPNLLYPSLIAACLLAGGRALYDARKHK